VSDEYFSQINRETEYTCWENLTERVGPIAWNRALSRESVPDRVIEPVNLLTQDEVDRCAR